MEKLEIRYTMTAPISHIGETASTGSYFNAVKTSSGKIPVITGNSIRGTIRDCLATHLLDKLGVQVDKETFNVLYSGGNISGSTKNDVERSKDIRQHFPMISLLGGGLGTMIMSGKLIAGFAYPICSEAYEITGEDSLLSWHDMIDEIEFTRFDDGKNDIYAKRMEDVDEEKKAKASTQMRFSVQYMAIGTEFVQQMLLDNDITDLEIGALLTGLAEWFKIPRLGGMSAKGFGIFKATVNGTEMAVDENGNITISSDYQKYIDDYNKFIEDDNTIEHLGLLTVGGKK